jgi:membrane-bound lytic murein transglycosylase B
MPATFNHYAVDGNGDGVKDIHNVDDAMYTAGRYLAAGGAARGQYSSALYNYNHSWDYVSHVMSVARSLGL